MSNSPDPAGRKRIRLSPELRSRQILDAALVEFSTHGFAATRMEDIAHRAGLSKAGLYAHYASKEEVFASLLSKVLTPVTGQWHWDMPEDVPVATMVDAFIERTYAQLQEPSVTAVVRLLIAEGSRVPHLVRSWRENVLLPLFAEQHEVLFGRGDCAGRLQEDFLLIYGPAVSATISRVVFGEHAGEEELKSAKRAHRRMLMALLEPSCAIPGPEQHPRRRTAAKKPVQPARSGRANAARAPRQPH